MAFDSSGLYLDRAATNSTTPEVGNYIVLSAL